MPIKLPLIFSFVAVVFKGRADLIAENMTLRHQLSCLSGRKPRPRLRCADRVFWVLLSRFWSGWTGSLAMVKPATVLAWHRQGFKLFWRWKSRKRAPGRRRISVEIRKLISEMAEMNVGWGAPRIHGELLKLGIAISEITVSRHMPKRPPPAGSRQRWATFVRNHLHETLAIDFAVVPTLTFGIVYVFFVLSLERRRVLHFNVTRHPTAGWTTQQVSRSLRVRSAWSLSDSRQRQDLRDLLPRQGRWAWAGADTHSFSLSVAERICRAVDR